VLQKPKAQGEYVTISVTMLLGSGEFNRLEQVRRGAARRHTCAENSRLAAAFAGRSSRKDRCVFLTSS